MSDRTWPTWWDWDLELTPYVFKRMVERHFTGIDLRTMIEKASDYRPDIVDGRWVIETRHRRLGWEVVVEPEEEREIIIVITAFPVSKE